jgi:hypothetical protein
MLTVTPSRRDHLPGLSPSYRSHIGPAATTWIDIFRDTSLPSLGLHSGLAIIGYAAAQSVDRAEVKDWLWPSGQVINAWSSAIGSPMFQRGVDFSTAWNHLTMPGRTLLLGVTAWGVRLLYRIASRSIARGQDDPRYVEAKKQPGFWNDAFFSLYLPEAVTQAIITLPFTAPFRYAPQHGVIKYTPVRCTPVRCISIRCTPLRYIPVRRTPIRCTPIRYTPIRCSLWAIPYGRAFLIAEVINSRSCLP